MSEQPASDGKVPAGAYFESRGPGRYRPTSHAEGAWNPGEIHFGPLSGLMVHAIDGHRAARGDAATGMQLGRVGFDILGFLAADDLEIQVDTVRPGRTIELVEARASIGGRAVAVARAWFVATSDTAAVAGGVPTSLPGPDAAVPWSLHETWSGGYVASIETRAVTPPQPGRTSAWLRTQTAIVAGEQASAHASFIALVDTANGIAVRQPPTEWMFPNLDLTIHLYRQPADEWVGLDTTVTFGPDGHGLTSTVLHDTAGPIGRAEQLLTVRPQRS